VHLEKPIFSRSKADGDRAAAIVDKRGLSRLRGYMDSHEP
jgi:hypothetical protein